jgi:hypothetical protein
LGIIVSVEAANKNYAAAIGKTVEALSDEEKKTAFLIEVREKSKGQLDEYAKIQDKTAENYSKLTAETENFANNLKEGLSVALASSAKELGDWIASLNREIDKSGIMAVGRSWALSFAEGFYAVMAALDPTGMMQEKFTKAQDMVQADLRKNDEKTAEVQNRASRGLDKFESYEGPNSAIFSKKLPKTLAELKKDTELLSEIYNMTAEEVDLLGGNLWGSLQGLQAWIKHLNLIPKAPQKSESKPATTIRA